MRSYTQAIRFVLAETARFIAMSVAQRQATDPYEFLWMLPHPTGIGGLICGLAAERAIADVSERATSQSEFANRIDPTRVARRLKQEVSRRFIAERKRVNAREVDAAIQASIDAAGDTVRLRTHFIPCHVVSNRATRSFAIGPVTFERRSLAFRSLRQALSVYVQAGRPETGDLRRRILGDVTSHYRLFEWVAKTTVPGCDDATSESIAYRASQSALDCLHLLVGASRSDRMSLDGRKQSSRRGRIVLAANGDADVSWSANWGGQDWGDNWWTAVRVGVGIEVSRLMGIAIQRGCFPGATPLSLRWLDAAAWYGEATRDRPGPSRLVKFVTAIERVCGVPRGPRQTNRLLDRWAALMATDSGTEFKRFRRRADDLYEVRSGVVHGATSKFERMGPALAEAEELGWRCLWGALLVFGETGLSAARISSAEVEAGFDRLVAWAKAGT